MLTATEPLGLKEHHTMTKHLMVAIAASAVSYLIALGAFT